MQSLTCKTSTKSSLILSDRSNSSSMRLVAGPVLPLNVRRYPQGQRVEFTSGTMDSHVHTLAGRHGLRLLLRFVHSPIEGSLEARRAVVLEEFE